MTCYFHADASAVAFCRSCGRPVCQVCQRPENGTVYCPEHGTAGSPPGSGGNPYFQAGGTSGATPLRMQAAPWVAFALGWIPGVGAIYNGQYIKGLVHAIVFGLLVSVLSSNDNGSTAAFLGILLAVFLFYMPFEAFHTARKRQQGIPVDEWSSLAGAPNPARPRRSNSAGPVILIGIGVLFLLDTLDVIEFRNVGRFWPVLLIVAGAYMLYSRTVGASSAASPAQGPPYGVNPQPVTPSGTNYGEEARRDQ